MKFLKILIISLFITSCVIIPHNVNIKQIKPIYAVTAEYKSYNQLKEEEINKAKQTFLTKKELKNNISRLPKNGYVIINYNSSSIDACNPKNYEYIFTTINDSVLQKTKGIYKLPYVSDYGFSNIDIQSLPDNCPDVIKLYVVWLSRDRGEFIIEVNKKF